MTLSSFHLSSFTLLHPDDRFLKDTRLFIYKGIDHDETLSRCSLIEVRLLCPQFTLNQIQSSKELGG